MSIGRIDISFRAEANISIGGWLFLPEGLGPHPAVRMCAGFGGTIHHGLEPFAVAFAEVGFATLLHDHRGFGSSGGQPRHDVDPWQQIADWRRAISYLESRPEVDAKRIGLWGTSYSGGHALMLGASDRGSRRSSPRYLRSAATSKAYAGFLPISSPPSTRR